MIDFQYYPTPKALADLVWSKFQDRDFTRVLEPSAGMGHMIKAAPRNRYHNGERKIDVIEIDASKHSALRDLDGARVTVVGYDFLAFESGAAYSHIVGNPPFDSGAQHILHAWDILYDGEICMVLNAETVRNPYTVERRRLVSLIEEHGSVEYVHDAFQRSENEDVEREAQVTVAVVYLRKQADESSIEARMTASLLGSLKRDADGADGSKDHIDIGGGDVVLPNNFIENSVLAFDAAVIAMRESVLAEAKYNNFAARLGRTLAEMDGSGGMGRQAVKAEWVRDTMAERYDEMKERAWSGILRSTQVHGKLSRKAQARVESEFAMISKLEFTVGNIHGFLLGLAESATDIQNQMFCDVFDLVTKYHSDNCVFYKGFKSNDRHRTCGMRMRTTRFILPGWSMGSYRSNFSYDGLNMLADFDRVFALLDGKTAPEVPLTSLFKDGICGRCATARVCLDPTLTSATTLVWARFTSLPLAKILWIGSIVWWARCVNGSRQTLRRSPRGSGNSSTKRRSSTARSERNSLLWHPTTTRAGATIDSRLGRFSSTAKGTSITKSPWKSWTKRQLQFWSATASMWRTC